MGLLPIKLFNRKYGVKTYWQCQRIDFKSGGGNIIEVLNRIQFIF